MMCKQQFLTFRPNAQKILETMELEMSKMDNRNPRFLKRQEGEESILESLF